MARLYTITLILALTIVSLKAIANPASSGTQHKEQSKKLPKQVVNNVKPSSKKDSPNKEKSEPLQEMSQSNSPPSPAPSSPMHKPKGIIDICKLNPELASCKGNE
ncbi:hypothetical protein DXX93_10260 [Thalassotalea euphylliae]|uniref:Uncharacterized protein n=1 Tax=Thalassotalea euphylliae TaxID=1655234 RepID=A0A3E0TQX6_9GAMM|nr:hypothetical protein [Thalassotalea euphylliae]REL26914.1 hypothetical protein DXX93_10260 [Thalassotalea euphylliae]